MLESTADSVEDTKLKNLNTFSAILLGVFTVTAFVANIFLLTTIASSYHLRNTIFYFHVLHLACINLTYTAINSLLSMLYVSTGEWRLGRIACSFNSFIGELLAVETMYGVTLLTVDRAVALLSISKYESRMTPLRTFVAIAGCWLIGIVITFPVLIGSIQSEAFPARFFCSVSRNPLGYPIATVIVCYIFPLFVVLWAIGLVLFRMHKDRVRRRAMLPDRFGDYTDFIVDNRRVQKHTELAKFSVITFIVYYILQGPYYTFKFFSQIHNSADFIGNNVDTPSDAEKDAETAITLLYSLFLVVFPIVTFCYAKDIWKKFQDLVCCRKTNVVSTTIAHTASTIAGGGSAFRSARGMVEEVRTGNVVTIMPTSDGIHQIRPGRDEPEYADVPRRVDVDYDKKNNTNRMTDGGTSDYDSEGSDTFEEANPDNLNKSKTNVTAQVYKKTETADGAVRKTRLEIDSSASNFQNNIIINQPTTPTASQSEIRLQSSDQNKNVNSSNNELIETNIKRQPSHKRSKSESAAVNNAKQQAPKRKSLDENLLNSNARLPPVSRRSSMRLLNPGAVPSPVNTVRNKPQNSANNQGRLPPLPTLPISVPNMPQNRLRTDSFELKLTTNSDSKADDSSADSKKRKTSIASKSKRKT